MRVLLLTQVLPYPPDSGPTIKTWNLLRHIARRCDVTLVSFVRGDQSEAVRVLEGCCRAVHTVPMSRCWTADAGSLARSLLTRRPFLILRDDRAAMHALVDRVTRHTRFDIVHADQLSMAPYALRVAGAARVLDAHNALWLLCQRLARVFPAGPRKLLLRRESAMLRRYEGMIARQFDAVLTVNEDDRTALVDAGAPAGVTDVVPIAIDSDETTPIARPSDANRIVHIGTMYWPPNIDAIRWFVREVLPLIRLRQPRAAVDLIGGRPPYAIRRLAGAHISVTGYVSDPSLYLQQAGAVVVPVRVGSGMRVKILTALAQALPVVCTSAACSGIAVESGRHVLVADTPRDFAAAVLALLADRSLADTLGRNGRTLVERHYDVRTVGERVVALYSRLCRTTGGLP